MSRSSCNKPYMHVWGAPTANDQAGFQINEKFSWDDLRIAANALLIHGGGSDPALVTWKTVNKLYAFVANDELGFITQLPHHYALGEDLKVHVHWTPMARGITEDGHTVPWKVDATIAVLGGVFPNITTYDLTDTCDGVDDAHQMTPDVVIDGSGIDSVSAVISGRVYRDGAGTWEGVAAANSPALLEVDFHYPISSLGSRTSTDK